MNHKTPSIISAILTIIMLILFGLLAVFFEMILLNGASEKQATIALGISVICNGVGALLPGLFAGWLTKLVITKYNWNKILAVAIAVIISFILGVVVSFVSVIISILAAGLQ